MVSFVTKVGKSRNPLQQHPSHMRGTTLGNAEGLSCIGIPLFYSIVLLHTNVCLLLNIAGDEFRTSTKSSLCFVHQGSIKNQARKPFPESWRARTNKWSKPSSKLRRVSSLPTPFPTPSSSTHHSTICIASHSPPLTTHTGPFLSTVLDSRTKHHSGCTVCKVSSSDSAHHARLLVHPQTTPLPPSSIIINACESPLLVQHPPPWGVTRLFILWANQ